MVNQFQNQGAPSAANPTAYLGGGPNMLLNTRRPTTKDYQYELGTWWVIPKKASSAAAGDPTREVWVLMSVRERIADWKKLGGGAGPVGTQSIKVTTLTTPGAGTFTFDPAMVQVQVECVGGGGGSYAITGNGTDNRGGSGAGGGAYCKQIFNASQVGSSQPYVVGAGGAAGIAGPIGMSNPTFFPGGNGGASTFSSGPTLMTAGGGSGCTISPESALGGVASGGFLNVNGGGGTLGTGGGGFSQILPGGGGSSAGGYGVATPISYTLNATNIIYLPVAGAAYGSGSTGLSTVITVSQAYSENGAPGGQGIIIITEYLG